jgi:isopenicillin-N N-acyltransferase-like protein
VLVPASRGGPLAGQTWDLNPPDVDYIVAIRRRPMHGPSTWAVTCVGCPTLMGVNDRGLAVGTTNIKTYGSRPGAGYLTIIHRAIRESSAIAASAVVAGAPHAGAHTYWVADAREQHEWEASPNAQLRRDTGEGPLCRSNHCLFDLHRKIEGEAPTDSSRARLARMERWLDRPTVDVDGLKALFADRSDGVRSINRYPEDDEPAATNAVFIALLAEKAALACRGPADRGEWVRLDFDT